MRMTEEMVYSQSRVRVAREYRRDADVLFRFIELYCRKHHQNQSQIEVHFEATIWKANLCSNCFGLFDYGISRLIHCPYQPKPPCKRCPNHCYEPEKRALIREIMRYSGTQFILRGRLDWLIKYFLMVKQYSRPQLREKIRQHLSL